jgi:hypothetical protein
MNLDFCYCNYYDCFCANYLVWLIAALCAPFRVRVVWHQHRYLCKKPFQHSVFGPSRNLIAPRTPRSVGGGAWISDIGVVVDRVDVSLSRAQARRIVVVVMRVRFLMQIFFFFLLLVLLLFSLRS